MAVVQKGQDGREAVLDGLPADEQGLGSFGDLGQAGGDPVLLGLQQVQRDRVGIVGLEQLGALGFEPLALGAELLAGYVGFDGVACQMLAEVFLDGVS